MIKAGALMLRLLFAYFDQTLNLLCISLSTILPLNITAPIKRMILLVAYCLYSSFASSHIDYAAHIGGLVFGFIMAFIVCAKELSKKGGGT